MRAWCDMKPEERDLISKYGGPLEIAETLIQGRLSVEEQFVAQRVLSSIVLEAARICIVLRREQHSQRLSEQVTELQAAATRAVEERRANDLTWQVSEFHRAFNYPVRHTPAQCTKAELKFRLSLITEEFHEVLEACCSSTAARDNMVSALAMLRNVIDDDLDDAVDLVALADGLGDLDYVIEGTRLHFGIPRQAVANAIQASNMAKVGGGYDENGKAKKPPGWKPPDIAGVLRDHGWTGR